MVMELSVTVIVVYSLFCKEQLRSLELESDNITSLIAK
jgi:hypothetical protein